ncbi:MAG: glycoside hydrolase family 32 protein [Clostridia bacterium]|nr:glycoside hydrolase family 32 protein [Clostridia bacterium]
MNQKLLFARAYEAEAARQIPALARPLFHLTPYSGWMNDPNGFSYYEGKYHLFYQYNPYDTEWDDMHWGHAVSEDLLHWTFLPAAMAPDAPQDDKGCWSGSALTLPDGRQLLLYTGVRPEGGERDKDIQTQCVAIGDGLNYEKPAHNPVIDWTALPPGCDKHNFRDPRIWQEQNGKYRCVVGTCDENHLGKLLLYESEDCFSWTYLGMLMENDGSLGRMWECPDFFTLEGKQVVLISPQDMLPEGLEYHNGNGTVAFLGHFDESTHRFLPQSNQAVDYGIDFYAPTTVLSPDGRRIMIGWMQNRDTTKLSGSQDRKWFGQMTLPRELFIKDGRLYQRPIRELDACRRNPVSYRDVLVEGEVHLPGIEGRTVDLELTIRPEPGEPLYHKFAVRFMQNEQFRSALSYRPHESILRIDRKFSGSRRAYIHQRRCQPLDRQGEIQLRLILDRFSAEVFVNDGHQTMTATIFTDLAAKGISFFADGKARLDVTKYDLLID